MEYQKIANFLDNEVALSASDQPSKFRIRNWLEINDESSRTYTDADIKFKITMLRSNLCDYADADIFVKGTITITGAGDDDDAKRLDKQNEAVIFKNCARFTKCISRINNTDIDDSQDIDIVMPLYNVIEYSDNCSKTLGSLYQYYKDEPNDNIVQSESFKSKIKITAKTPADGNTKEVEIIVPLKYLSYFLRTFEMPLINCEVNLELTWSRDCVISSATVETKINIRNKTICSGCNFITTR